MIGIWMETVAADADRVPAADENLYEIVTERIS